MKKAIFFAIVALLSFSSCKLDNGGYPIPDNGNVLLWRKVSSNIGQVDIYTRFFICADAVLYMDEDTQNLVKELWFNNHDITLEDGKVVFVEKNNKYSQVKYIVVTDGKKAIAVALEKGVANDIIAVVVDRDQYNPAST